MNYKLGSRNQVYDNVYKKCSETLKNTNCITIGCLIDIEKFSYIYGETINPNDDLFFEVAMQAIIENYSHFLLGKKNSVGDIVYESRNNENVFTEKSSDSKMYNNFCKIKACNKGISFINQETILKTIRYFYTYSKKEDVPGLQLADFVAYNMLQSENMNKNQYTEFMNKINDRLYNGKFNKTERDLTEYFGLKHLPFDFETIHRLEEENSKIQKSNKNLKEERKKLNKKNTYLINGKNNLIEENKKLENKIKQLNTQLKELKKLLTIKYNLYIIVKDTVIIL